MNLKSPHNTQVLICGGGPVGLTLAIELGTSGIDCLVVDQKIDAPSDPKAKFVNLRSMTFFRRWGIADRVRRAAPIPPDYPSDVVWATRLAGREIFRIKNAFSTAQIKSELYPEPTQRIPQPILESVLREKALSLPSVRIRRGWRVENFTQSESEVQIQVVDVATNESETLFASYIIGCDGARSTVRKHLEIGMLGEANVAQSLGTVFRAPSLWDRLTLDRAVHYWIMNDDLPVMVGIGPLDLNGLWFFQMMGIPTDTDVSLIDPKDIVSACLGDEIECSFSDVTPWVVHNLSAEKYRVRRAFIMGDAAHLHAPTGGFGMNTGIGDAVDLGWKLAAVLQGWGSDALLDTYEIERRGIHSRVIGFSGENFASQRLLEPGLEDISAVGEERRRLLSEKIRKAKSKHYRSIGVQLGYRYEGSPLVVADGTQPPADDEMTYVATARPGSIAPHSWLKDGKSIYDTFGNEFTLLDLGDENSGASAVSNAARKRGVPLKVVRLSDPALRELYQADLALIRPDQHVAWRASGLPSDPLTVIDQVRGAFVGTDVSTEAHFA